MTSAVTTLLALVLGAGAGAKAWRVDQAAEALATYGISRTPLQRLAAWGLISIELCLAAGLLAGAPGAVESVAGLFLVFALLTSAALLAGRRGRPCACFASASRLSWASPLRALALATLASVAALGWLPSAPTSYDRWLTIGLSVAVAGLVALAVAVLALAREVGVLRLELTSRGALEIGEEGPAVGVAQAWASAVPRNARAVMLLAVFTSDGCPLCRRVAPAVAHVAKDPLVGLRVFDELADASTWRQARAPGSPYAVALDLDGVALAKGTFNGLAQLESILATARARERELAIAA
jgi:hypothetical protein